MHIPTAAARYGSCVALAFCILAVDGGSRSQADGASAALSVDRGDSLEQARPVPAARPALRGGFMADMQDTYEIEARKGRTLEEAKRAMQSRREQAVDREIRSEIDAALRARTVGSARAR